MNLSKPKKHKLSNAYEEALCEGGQYVAKKRCTVLQENAQFWLILLSMQLILSQMAMKTLQNEQNMSTVHGVGE